MDCSNSGDLLARAGRRSIDIDIRVDREARRRGARSRQALRQTERRRQDRTWRAEWLCLVGDTAVAR